MGHGKETPRQKMIGMMYLVLTAMLALNVSKDILNAFVLVNNGLAKTTANFVDKNNTSYSIFEAQMAKTPDKVRPFLEKAYEVRKMADELAFLIQELKVEIVSYCDGSDAPAFTPMELIVGGESRKTHDIDASLIKAKDNYDKPSEVMILKKRGEELKQRIEAYRSHLVSLTNDVAVQHAIEESLKTDDMVDLNGTLRSWEFSFFDGVPLVAVVTLMTKMQSDVRNAEADLIQFLLSQIGATDTKVNKMEAIVQAKTGYVLKGGEYEARILLAAYDSLQKPEILLGPYRRTAEGGYEMVGEGRALSYDARGRAIYRASGSSVGNFTLQGLLRQVTPDGIVSFPFSSEYQVGEAGAVISADKMNVLYIGVENPLSISASGVPAERVTASISQGTLVKAGSSWIAKVTTPGEATVTVTANIDGQNRKMGDMKYRVKTVPDPVAKVANRTGGKIDKGTLVAQMAVLAILDNFEFDMKFNVTEFNVSATIGGFTQNEAAKGARITDKQKTILNRLSKGQKVFFDDIKAQGPDGKIRELPAVSFTID